MSFVTYISNIAIPISIFIIILFGVFEKKKVFDLFLQGVKEGLQIVIKIFPTLLGLFVAIGLLRDSGVIDFCIKFLDPILIKLSIPNEIMPLAILRPISGNASIAVATDIMKQYGVDSLIGIIAGVIMGSTETTIYTIAIYTSSIKIKKTKGVLIAALIADVVGMIASVAICRFLS